MLDESIPLTTGEYDEWGNPNDPVYFDYMLSYSPYDQVKARKLPCNTCHHRTA
jgi:oligopeptidase B